MHHMDEEAPQLVVRFLRSAIVNHHVTPLATGSSAARSLVRVGAARRGTAAKRRSVSPRALGLVVLVDPAAPTRLAQI